MTPDPIHDVEELSSSYSCKKVPNARSIRSLRTTMLAIPMCIFGAFFIGFIIFTSSLGSKDAVAVQKADAIVVFTGGSDRISDAIELLASGYGNRLLISGVNLSTSIERLSKLTQRGSNFFNCCIDIDYAARNTVENAIETRRWVDERNIKSLIVVTSNYHMPRAMIELQRALPDVKLIAHPIVSDRPLTGDIFARSFTSAKIMATEYTKFVISYARSLIFPKLVMTASTHPVVYPMPTGNLPKNIPVSSRTIDISSRNEKSLPQ